VDPETARKNVRLGLILFVLAVLIAGVTIVTAYIYNSAN
jgi:hypothetical protein